MSNFICQTCGHTGYKTPREIRYENALKTILHFGPACQHDKDCLLNGGDGYDQGRVTCACVLAKTALKGEKI